MNRAPALSHSRIPVGFWLSGMLLLLGAIWLGLMAVELGLATLMPSTYGRANFWSQQTLIGAAASLVSMAIGALIFLFNRRRHRHDHVPHRRQQSRRPIAELASKAEAPPPDSSDDDESVSFDMTPPTRRAKVKVKVRVKQRIRRGREGDKG